MAELVEVHVPAAEKLRVVLAHLRTHRPAARSEVFPPADARRLRRQREGHLPPGHGSWWHRAAMALAVLARQCLPRRVPEVPTLGREVAAWEARRHRHQAPSAWRLTTKDARINLKRLYPKYSVEQTPRVWCKIPRT